MFGFSLTLQKLESLYGMQSLPTQGELKTYLKKAVKALNGESTAYRPVTSSGNPGALLHFTDSLPTIIIPDLHARADFLLAVMKMTVSSSVLGATGDNKPEGSARQRSTVFEALQRNQIRVICLGDALHAESRERERWLRSYACFIQGQAVNAPMLDEMQEGLSLILMICALKAAFPENFHFLKGNHENILNQDSNGNHAFKKFAAEGEMVYEFMKQVYGNGCLQLYDSFEKALPLFVQTPWYLASHAEPSRVFSSDEIINAYTEPDVVFGLTWTPNEATPPDVVPAMLKQFIPDNPHALWFAGHRPVIDAKYQLRAHDTFVQLHNPSAMNVALIPGKSAPFDFNTQIISVLPWTSGFKGDTK